MDIHGLKRKVLSYDYSEEGLTAREIEVFKKLLLKRRQSHFPSFCKGVLPEVVWMPFQIYIMERIQVAMNTPYSRTLFELPPQHGKTTIITYLFSAFYLGRYPDRKVANATYNSDRASENSQGVKDILGLDTYKAIFATRIKSTDENEALRDKKKMKNKKDSVRRFSLLNSTTGEYKAVGVGEALTGYSADLITVDDYHKDYDEASSFTARESVWNWYTSVVIPRSQKHGTPIFILATRWHEDDLIGRLKKLGRRHKDDTKLLKAEIISFPAERDLPDFDERPYDTRGVGDALWPEKEPTYYEIKVYNPRVWKCVYQQRPPTEEGVIIQRHWIRSYRQMPEAFDRIVISVDTSFNARAKQSDDCAIEVWGVRGLDYYLIKFIARRMGYVETKRIVAELIREFPNYSAVLVELKANGAALIEDLKENFSRIIDYDPLSKTKRQRLEHVTPLFEAAHIYFPTEELCPDIHVFVEQLLQFTGLDATEKDDLVDAMTQALWYMDQYNIRLSTESFMTCKRMTSYQLATKLNGGRHGSMGQNRVRSLH